MAHFLANRCHTPPTLGAADLLFVSGTILTTRAAAWAFWVELSRVGGFHHRYEWSEAA